MHQGAIWQGHIMSTWVDLGFGIPIDTEGTTAHISLSISFLHPEAVAQLKRFVAYISSGDRYLYHAHCNDPVLDVVNLANRIRSSESLAFTRARIRRGYEIAGTSYNG